MPQPFRSKSVITTGRNKILERPELAARLANIIADWRNIEEILELLYGQVLRASISRNRQSHRVTDILSRDIFQSIYILDTKLTIISGALNMLDDHTHHDTFVALCPAIRKQGAERNNLIHNTWALCDDYPDALILMSSKGNMIYKLKDFVDISTRVQAVAGKLLAFVSKLPDSRAEQRKLTSPASG